jgi:malate dehydrogenase (oxaloacetate-decarboxylating)
MRSSSSSGTENASAHSTTTCREGAAVVLGGLLAAMRFHGERLRDQRVVIVGTGAAGIGIARLINLAMIEEGASPVDAHDAISVVDSGGLVHDGRPALDENKRSVARAAARLAAEGFTLTAAGPPPTLAEVVRVLRPTVLLGATGVPGLFDEPLIRAMVERAPRPIVMPLSNPTTACEATPSDILQWSDDRAIVAAGSPFQAVEIRGRLREVGQANNVFVFPGLGLGALVAEARTMPDGLFLAAGRELAACVTDERFESGALYPPVSALRQVTRAIARAVAREAAATGVAALRAEDVDAAIDAAMWWPAYVPYVWDDGSP